MSRQNPFVTDPSGKWTPVCSSEKERIVVLHRSVSKFPFPGRFFSEAFNCGLILQDSQRQVIQIDHIE